MSEVLTFFEMIKQPDATLILSGLVFVFAFQLVVFRWVERSNLLTATYFAATVASVGGPFVWVVAEAPDRVLNISDGEVVWALLSFLMTIGGIACSAPPQQRCSTVTTVAWPPGSARFSRAA